jgi:hypothetical protein
MGDSRIKLLIVAIILMLGIRYAYKQKRHDAPIIQEQPTLPIQTPQKHSSTPPEIKPVEPQFDSWPKVRNVQNTALGNILQDIDSHMPAGHQYSANNKVTWAHETTHGINSNIRNKHQDASKVNGFYCLQDRACVIYEPKTTIRAIAPKVPQALRGPSYQLYLVQQAGDWNDRPLYLFDEWIAYTNGSETGRELNHQDWYYELLQAHNFNVYCMYLAMTVKKTCPDYDDKQMKAFMMWNIERTFRLAAPFEKRVVLQAEPEEVGNMSNKHLHHHDIPHGGDDSDPIASALGYVEKVRALPEAEKLRKFARDYFGDDWCKKVYGF